MENEKMLIGIDPDTKKSGVAFFLKNYTLELYNLTFFEIHSTLLDFQTNFKFNILVIIDAGWLNKSNFHVTGTNNKVNGKIGERVGANHEVGKKIAEMCEYLGIEYKLNKPTNSKVNAEYFKKLTGYKNKTNQDQRDAGMLVYGLNTATAICSNLSINGSVNQTTPTNLTNVSVCNSIVYNTNTATSITLTNANIGTISKNGVLTKQKK